MESYLYPDHYDLVTPDGLLTKIERRTPYSCEAEVFIDGISPAFVGFQLDKEAIIFNVKSTLAQVGIEAHMTSFELDVKTQCAQVQIEILAIGELGKVMLELLKPGMRVGKLFAADERRRVRDPYYLSRMFGRSDRDGNPLLSLGGMQGSGDLILDKLDGRTVAYLTLQNGRVHYQSSILGFLPTLARGLSSGHPTRELLRLHQEWHPHEPKNVVEGELLLVRTLPLHIRTVFARVCDEYLADGFHHTAANVLQPDTKASGDIYELYGNAGREITDIPLEFYTLEPHREHIFFEDRDQLQTCLEQDDCLFEAFKNAPEPSSNRAAVFVVKGQQLLDLKAEDWISRETYQHDFPGLDSPLRQALMVERYIDQQPSTPFLRAIESGLITSQGVLLTRHFPSPLMKRYLLSTLVQRDLKGIYFHLASQSSDQFFSHEDRALLHDLAKFGIPVFWVDSVTQKILQYVQKPGRESGMFVPLDQVENFLKSTVWGVYGSNLVEGDFETELKDLLAGVWEMRESMNHHYLNPETPMALVTGGGPGAMEVGNRVARSLGILSCANIVDFRAKSGQFVNEQLQNPHIDAKMTYRLDRLVERQAEFHLDFPIFLMGGMGTDFELTLEEIRRKVGTEEPTPVLLFGTPEYWKAKVSSRFQKNLETGTIRGSEWVSNCFYCVRNAQEGLDLYRSYFSGELAIGPDGPSYEEGFAVAATVTT